MSKFFLLSQCVLWVKFKETVKWSKVSKILRLGLRLRVILSLDFKEYFLNINVDP